MTVSLKVEFEIIDSPGGFIEVDHFCTSSPPPCCGVQSSTLPPGYSLLVEFTTYLFPPGAKLEHEWCELVDACCTEAGSIDPCASYSITSGCCGKLPFFINFSFSGACSSLNNASWAGALSWRGVSAGYPDGSWLVQNGSSDPIPISAVLYCVGGILKADIRCGAISDTDPPWFTVNLTIDSCCPFAAAGTVTVLPSACCDGGPVTLNVWAPEDSASGSGTSDFAALIHYQEWSFPDGTTVTTEPCEIDPQCCTDVTCEGCCGNKPMPGELFVHIVGVEESGSGPNCNTNGMLGKVIRAKWNQFGCFWSGCVATGKPVDFGADFELVCGVGVTIFCLPQSSGGGSGGDAPATMYHFSRSVFIRQKGTTDNNICGDVFADCQSFQDVFRDPNTICDRPVLDAMTVCFDAWDPLCNDSGATGGPFVDTNCCRDAVCIDVVVTE